MKSKDLLFKLVGGMYDYVSDAVSFCIEDLEIMNRIYSKKAIEVYRKESPLINNITMTEISKSFAAALSKNETEDVIGVIVRDTLYNDPKYYMETSTGKAFECEQRVYNIFKMRNKFDKVLIFDFNNDAAIVVFTYRERINAGFVLLKWLEGDTEKIDLTISNNVKNKENENV